MTETSATLTSPAYAPDASTFAVLAMYKTHTDAEGAVKALQRAGLDMRKLSIVGRNYETEENVVGYYNTGDRVRFWGKWGAVWGGLSGILFGSALLLVPVVGHLVVLGPLVSWIANGLAGAAVTGGLSALGAALYSIGIPKNSILEYETGVRAGKFLLMMHGTEGEVRQGESILAASGAESIDVHGPRG
jgi:hypothetical protein